MMIFIGYGPFAGPQALEAQNADVDAGKFPLWWMSTWATMFL